MLLNETKKDMHSKEIYFERTKRRHTRGKSLPYIYNNKVYLGKKTQKGSGAISKMLSNLIPIVEQAVSELIPI